jgi:hypothetical protein
MNRVFSISWLWVLFVPVGLWGQINLEEGLILYYSFTGEVFDEGPNGLQPEIIAANEFVEDYTGEMNSALNFTGENSYFQIPHTDLLNFDSADPFSISIWLRPDQIQEDDAGTVNDILSKWYTDENIKEELGYPFVLRYYNQTSSLNGVVVGAIFGGESSSCFDNDLVATNRTLNDGKWHHVLFTKDENMQLAIYLDCRLEATFYMEYSCSPQNTAPLRVGKRGPPHERNYTGGIDEWRIYDRVVSPEELGVLCGMTTTSAAEVNSMPWAVYPNPTTGMVFLEAPGEVTTLQLFDQFGKEWPVSNSEDRKGVRLLDFGQLPPGLYFLRGQQDGQMVVRKLMVQ